MFPSGGSKARRAKPSRIHQRDHSGIAGVKSHEWQPLLARRSSPSRRGWWVARLHRHTRTQPSRLSGAPLALTRGTLQRSTPQLCSHALRPAERGCGTSAPHEEHLGGSGGQAFRSPGGDGDGPRGATSASRASRGSGLRRLVRIGFFTAHRQLLQHPLYKTLGDIFRVSFQL